MPCIRCGKVTVKWCTCSIGEAKEAFSAWSEVELRQASYRVAHLIVAWAPEHETPIPTAARK